MADQKPGKDQNPLPRAAVLHLVDGRFKNLGKNTQMALVAMQESVPHTYPQR